MVRWSLGFRVWVPRYVVECKDVVAQCQASFFLGKGFARGERIKSPGSIFLPIFVFVFFFFAVRSAVSNPNWTRFSSSSVRTVSSPG